MLFHEHDFIDRFFYASNVGFKDVDKAIEYAIVLDRQQCNSLAGILSQPYAS